MTMMKNNSFAELLLQILSQETSKQRHQFSPPFWGVAMQVSGDGDDLASYPGRVGGERRPGIDCLRMRGRFRYISVKL